MRKILYLSAILTFCVGNVAAETDPVQNLVRAMVELKKTGSVCEPYLKSSPLDAMTGIDVFFTALNQPVPNPRDKAAQARLGQFDQTARSLHLFAEITDSAQSIHECRKTIHGAKIGRLAGRTRDTFPAMVPRPGLHGLLRPSLIDRHRIACLRHSPRIRAGDTLSIVGRLGDLDDIGRPIGERLFQHHHVDEIR
jgi:hypothetical protein